MQQVISNFELQIAWRYLITKRKEGFISVTSALSLVGIALGVATLIIVMSVMEGYEVELIKRILGINGHITITRPQKESMPEDNELLRQIQNIPGVKFAAPIIVEQAMVFSSSVASGAVVRGMDGSDLQHKPAMQESLVEGEFQDYMEGRGVLVGAILARHLGIELGDELKLIAPQVEHLAIGAIPRAKTLKVVGIFDVGMYEYDSSTIFMPLKIAQLLFKTGGNVGGIEIILDQYAKITLMKKSILEILPPSLMMVDWAMKNAALISALQVERTVMFMILLLIIIIAAFNIITSLTMLVQDKQKSIAILKTIGMNSVSIIKIFMICGFIIGALGTIFGCLLGVAFTLNIENIRSYLEACTGVKLFDPVVYFLTSLPAELSMSNVIIIMLIAFLLSFVATIYPAWKASKILPAEALRSS